MYRELFDLELQEEMTSFYLNHLSKLGILKTYKKGEEINPPHADEIYIVIKGALKEVLYSTEGDEICFFRLPEGTIGGEMDYFDGYRTCVLMKAIKKSVVCSVHRDVLEKELAKHPRIYRYFIHSITRKYRLLMLKMADDKFNDSTGKLASTLLRFAAMQEGELKNDTTIEYRYTYTHEELAKYLGCSRITVTNVLNFFKENNLIDVQNKHITIKNVDGLKQYVKSLWF
ncbi:Crp/Fnr family transcriptional regulator [Wukongibacter baidiensis]|uniref:Crp/Fnr family transcriptional regulator n=1 Tax=Wukongibacter baidiensis TaxID=1723361 RepID=UPI003D7F38B9